MSLLPIQRELLVALIKEVLKEDPTILNDVWEEIKQEQASDERTKQIRNMIEADFDRFDEVFKSLA
ncbi:MAG: hypothetical protein KDC54_16005 [Lewinella sp.]|nr:hypothetical protein [Lewinella sp.]